MTNLAKWIVAAVFLLAVSLIVISRYQREKIHYTEDTGERAMMSFNIALLTYFQTCGEYPESLTLLAKVEDRNHRCAGMDLITKERALGEHNRYTFIYRPVRTEGLIESYVLEGVPKNPEVDVYLFSNHSGAIRRAKGRRANEKDPAY